MEQLRASDDPLVQRLVKKYTLKQLELNGLHELEQLEQKSQRAALERKYLQKIRAIVHKIAHANQITHVLNMHDSLNKIDGLQATIDSPIVYTKPEFNITSLVLFKLNEDYDNEQSKAKEKAKREEPVKQPKPAKAESAEPAKE